MGNTFTCFERGRWDAHQNIVDNYVPSRTDVYQDMTLPLPNYFISSGHNSYLTGDQLFSASGTGTITKCLQAGCRVIELDVYNGPVCKHGGTLTASVGFQDCIEAIAAHAFTASPYPVILTMENHADMENQAKMAAILRGVLGDRLYVPDPHDPMKVYLSPEMLKNKVVCRTSIKKSGEYDKDFLSLIYIRNTKFTSMAEMIDKDTVASSSFEELSIPQSEELGRSTTMKAEKMKRMREEAIKSQNLEQSPVEDEVPADAVVGQTIVAGSLQELYKYTSRHMMRVYPSGWRVTSSNYSPMTAWVRGASLAALNWQVWGKPMFCNEAKFMDNGGCGYVLKPAWMREPPATLPSPAPRTLVVRIHSAHKYQGRNFLIFKDDLFVKMTIWGMPADRASKHTKTARDTGRLKVEKDFEFDIMFPEMAVLCIQLMDEDAVGGVASESLGYFSLPLATLREGEYKLVLKKSSTGQPISDRNAWIKVGFRWAVEGANRAKEEANGAKEEANPMFAGPEPEADK